MADQFDAGRCSICDTPLIYGTMGQCRTEGCAMFGARTRNPLSGETPWPVTLGLAIRAFCRRAEVAALRNEVLGSAHQWKACWRPEDDDRRAAAWGGLLSALDRLASLATEDRT